MQCDFCDDSFELIPEPSNCFVGYLRDDNGKPVDGRITLCHDCYIATTFGYTDLSLHIYAYPMRWRAEHCPIGPQLKFNGNQCPGKPQRSHEDHMRFLIEEWALSTGDQDKALQGLARRKNIASRKMAAFYIRPQR